MLDDATVTHTPGSGTTAPAGPTTGGNTTSGDDSTLGGTQVTAPVTAPIGVTGNAISVLDDATVTRTPEAAPPPPPAPPPEGTPRAVTTAPSAAPRWAFRSPFRSRSAVTPSPWSARRP
ncbi:hypothetical protein [Microbacterium sp. Se63.02b]|uniref:hypothetical protein n=1 Tax=Microbacterium sp. Se63.02b TaxID=2709304 RepID=UPI001AEF2020|nr:hypothetical protein [Microbacterium sp. Se63.02b]